MQNTITIILKLGRSHYRFIVRGCDQSWDSSEIFGRYFDQDLVCNEEPGCNAYGKLPHLAAAMREVERREGGSTIDRDEVLLVDDEDAARKALARALRAATAAGVLRGDV